MFLQSPITYQTILQLVEQLPDEQKEHLLLHLIQQAKTQQPANEERKTLYHASILDMPVNEAPSIRRADWYDDDGR